MQRSGCCKSELVYISDGKIKIDRKHLPKLASLENVEGKTFYYECGICNKACDLSQRPDFTLEQMDWICYQIGDWYLMMKPLLEGQHNLGFMKEKLKMMICGDE